MFTAYSKPPTKTIFHLQLHSPSRVSLNCLYYTPASATFQLVKMNKLTKAQKDELATSMAVLALYDGGVSF